MSLTTVQVRLLVEEIAPLVRGGVVRAVWCSNDRAIVLEARVPGANRFMLLSVEERAVRVALVERKPRQPEEPPSFVMALRRTLPGMRIEAFEQPSEDRVIRVVFGRTTDRAARTPDAVLVAELTGRHGNVFLLDPGGTVIGSLLPNRSYRRALVVGERYEPPAPPPPHAARALLEDSLGLGGLRPTGERSRAVERHYESALAAAAVEALAQRIRQALRRERESLEKRAASVRGDLDRAREAQQFRRWGELLQSAYGRVPRGATSIEVPDYYEPGMPAVTVPLDPAVDLEGNIERYFRRYKKFNAAVDRIEERLRRTETSVRRVGEMAERVEALLERVRPRDAEEDDPGESLETARAGLEALWTEIQEERLLSPRRVQRHEERRDAPARALPYRELVSSTGKTILVGKGGRQNDSLTLRVARGNDLWLHAHDWAGAHVVVRLERGEEIDHETLLDAACLAALHSKAKHAVKVEVLYTRAKHVSKPKGFPPGQVSVANARTILVRLDDETRIARLLGREES